MTTTILKETTDAIQEESGTDNFLTELYTDGTPAAASGFVEEYTPLSLIVSESASASLLPEESHYEEIGLFLENGTGDLLSEGYGDYLLPEIQWTVLCSGSSGKEIMRSLIFAGNVDMDIYLSMTDINATYSDGASGTLIARLAHQISLPEGASLEFAEKPIHLGTNKIWIGSTDIYDMYTNTSIKDLA